MGKALWFAFLMTVIVMVGSMIVGFFIGCELMSDVTIQETAIIKKY